MAIHTEPTEKSSVSRITCPACGEKVRGAGLEKGSVVSGLTFSCRRCLTLFRVTSK